MLTVDTPLLFLRAFSPPPPPLAPFCVSLRFLPFIFRMTLVTFGIIIQGIMAKERAPLIISTSYVQTRTGRFHHLELHQ